MNGHHETHRPQHPEGASIHYVAGPSRGHRALAIGVSLVFLIPAAFVMVAAMADHAWGFVIVVLVLCLLLIGFLMLAMRPRFVVSDAGILSRNMVRSRYIPWPEVARIEVDRRLVRRGQTVVLTRSGERIGTHITAASFAIRRGESTYDHGPKLLDPALPTRAAIEAHQRYLRGEFGRPTHQ